MADVSGILERLESSLGAREGEPIPLEGGITNRNFRIKLGGRDLFLRLPGKDTGLLGIDRTAERLAAARAAELGVGPDLVYADEDCSVAAYAPAGVLDGERLRADPAPVARALRTFHDSGLELPATFWVPSLLDDYATLVRRHGGEPAPAFENARRLVTRIARVLPLDAPVPCHDDLLPGNLMAGGDGILLVDWEYAGMGHRMFDLGNLAVNNDFDDAAEERLLRGYFGGPAPVGRRAALKLMRIVSDAREAAWGVVQSLISELDFDFGGYAAEHFERLEREASHPDLEGWLDAATA
jgi:thiamine kinase-like enzyme